MATRTSITTDDLDRVGVRWHAEAFEGLEACQAAAAEGRLTVLLPLYCRLCGAAQTKVAPPPEQSPIQRAQVLPAAPAALRER